MSFILGNCITEKLITIHSFLQVPGTFLGHGDLGQVAMVLTLPYLEPGKGGQVSEAVPTGPMLTANNRGGETTLTAAEASTKLHLEESLKKAKPRPSP